MLESLDPATRLAIRDHPTVVSLAVVFALNTARADMRQFLDAAARPRFIRILDLTRDLDRAGTLARAGIRDRDLDRALARALTRAIAHDLIRVRARARALAIAIVRARATARARQFEPYNIPVYELHTDNGIRSRIAAQDSVLAVSLAVALTIAGDLDHDLDRALTRTLDLDHAIALTRAHDLDRALNRALNRAIAHDLGLTRAFDRDLARAHEFALARARCDFVGLDLRRVDLTGRSLDGVRWSSATQWPAGWAGRIRRDSVEIEPGLFEIRPGTADASNDANPLAEPWAW